MRRWWPRHFLGEDYVTRPSDTGLSKRATKHCPLDLEAGQMTRVANSRTAPRTVEQPAGFPRWTTTRIARPARDLARSTRFYRDLLGLAVLGGFTDHDGYDGVFFALPGGGELELTNGPAEPGPSTDEDLLVLYLSTWGEVAATGRRLTAAGVRHIPSANPYWNRWGRTFLDPDGNRLVIATTERDIP
jgi:catechol 2,3-dioxygenase-like lactoylglutathione lyase family enzyme